MRRLEDRSWWPELVELKDVLSLRELSSRFGAAPAAISNALRRNGLERKHAPPGPRDKRDPVVIEQAEQALAKAGQAPLNIAAQGPRRGGRLAPFRHLIGTRIDREVAELAGVSVSAVTNYRRRHGIAAATRGGALTVPSAVSSLSKPGAPMRVVVNGQGGFKVTIDEEDFVVVASDIVEAARIARLAGRGEVRRIEYMGRSIHQ